MFAGGSLRVIKPRRPGAGLRQDANRLRLRRGAATGGAAAAANGDVVLAIATDLGGLQLTAEEIADRLHVLGGQAEIALHLGRALVSIPPSEGHEVPLGEVADL